VWNILDISNDACVAGSSGLPKKILIKFGPVLPVCGFRVGDVCSKNIFYLIRIAYQKSLLNVPLEWPNSTIGEKFKMAAKNQNGLG
jgi:hypothetical protein